MSSNFITIEDRRKYALEKAMMGAEITISDNIRNGIYGDAITTESIIESAAKYENYLKNGLEAKDQNKD